MNFDILGDIQELILDEDIDMEDVEELIGELIFDREWDDMISDVEDVDVDESVVFNDGVGM